MAEQKEVRKDYPGSYYDIKGLEKWLTQMAAGGIRLEQQMDAAKSLEFRQGKPANVRFLLIPDIKKKDKRTCEELQYLYAEQGWDFICRIPGQVIIYETEDLWAVKPAIGLTEEDYHRKWRNLRINMVAWIVLVVLMIGIVVWGLLSESITYYDRITVWPWVFMGSTLLPVILALLDISEIYDLYVWWKHYRQREEVPKWRAAATLRWTKRIGSWVVFAAVLLVPFLELVMENTDYRVWDLENANVPLVTLALVDESYVLDSCSVYEKSHLLVPDEIGVRTLWEETPGWWDNMKFTYYRLRGETMAYCLAESEAEEMTVWRRKLALPVETDSGFDAVWFFDDGEGFQCLAACAGDVTVTIELDSEGDLLAVLPQIYDIVTEYRASI